MDHSTLVLIVTSINAVIVIAIKELWRAHKMRKERLLSGDSDRAGSARKVKGRRIS